MWWPQAAAAHDRLGRWGKVGARSARVNRWMQLRPQRDGRRRHRRWTIEARGATLGAMRGASPLRRALPLVLVAALGGSLLAVWQHGRRRSSDPQTTQPPQAASAPSRGGLPRELPVSAHFLARKELTPAYGQLLSNVERMPGRPVPLQQLAAFLHQADEVWAARPVLDQVLALEPDSEAALGLLGVGQLRLGQLDRAEASFRHLVAVQPGSWNGHYHLGMLALRRRHFDVAERELRRALDREPSAFWSLRDMGVLRLRQGRSAEALASFDRAATARPDDPLIHVYRMHALEALGRLQEADEEYARYLQDHTHGTLAAGFAPRRAPRDASPTTLRFVDEAPARGLASVARGRAAAWVDLNGDGRLDLLRGYLEEVASVHLATADGSFEVAPGACGLDRFDNAHAVDAGDLDNDGDLDLYVTRGGSQNGRRGRDANLLFAGEGPCAFEDATADSGAGDVGMGFDSVLADFDRDGLLDIYVANSGESGRLFHNRGGLRFDDVSAAAGITSAARSRSVVAADLDGDGDADIFVANNGDDNLLFRNDTLANGPLRFTEVAFEARVALAGGFGCAAQDVNNDGLVDLVVSNMSTWLGGRRFTPGDPSYLFLNQGGLRFAEVGRAAGLDHVGGGAAPVLADFDADGWLDLYLATGGPEPRRNEADLLLRNEGCPPPGGRGCTPRFAEVTRAAGVWRPDLSARGPALADYDRDGALDVMVPSGQQVETSLLPDVLWRNLGHANHWLTIELRGQRSNRTALGATVTVEAGGLTQTRALGSGTQGGQDALELYFGLGQSRRATRVLVRWPAGGQQELRDLAVDRRLVIVEEVP